MNIWYFLRFSTKNLFLTTWGVKEWDIKNHLAKVGLKTTKNTK